jgi:hypothetical protein
MTEPNPTDIVGHKTFDTGETCPETGFPKVRHEPLTRAEADALWQAAEEAKTKRAYDMPDEQAAIRTLFDAWQRLKELGWRDGMYAPRDGKHFRIIELGSTGIFDCVCEGKSPRFTWTTLDERDAYPSSHPPAMFRLYPDDEAKEKERWAAAREKFAAIRDGESTGGSKK